MPKSSAKTSPRRSPRKSNLRSKASNGRRPPVKRKWVYLFEEGSAEMRDLLGGKGAGLAEMARVGLPVPPGFTITTEACNAYSKAGGKFPSGLWKEVQAALAKTEAAAGRKFGDPGNPLLVSVRSGAKFSMPGMMDTVLNLGLTDKTLAGLIAQTRNERFAWDAYRRLVQMFGKVVIGLDPARFEAVLDHYKERRGVKADTDLTADDLKAIAGEFRELVRVGAGREFPQDPWEQLRLAIEAVFGSWNGRRAVDYRNAMGISHDLGTAANVVTMVFGNMGDDSGTGVAFTRDPATGEKKVYGEYLLNAQGEDVVAGIRTPQPIGKLKDELPKAYRQFVRICDKLERHYKDVQDLEFTIERGKLWMLQTRTGKRTAQAAVKIAVDMVEEGIIDKASAVRRLAPSQVDMLMHPRFDEDAKAEAAAEGRKLAQGLNASPGAAVGLAVFDADTAAAWGEEGKAVILVRPETTPDDVHGMLKAKGILTQHGGATSHAAVVARGIGLPCVAGCEAIRVDVDLNQFTVGNQIVRQGDTIAIDGGTGEVFSGTLPTIAPKFEEQTDLVKLLSWADEVAAKRSRPGKFPSVGLQVWANADYPRDAERARLFGAVGIGLCRTEHMFFEQDRLPLVQQMILAETDAEREAALAQLEPIQKDDFKGILRAMSPCPVIIRLIDPPLHEFLPSYDELLKEVTELGVRVRVGDAETQTQTLTQTLAEKEKLLRKVRDMREANPMLGLRGVRLGIVWPAINQMQVRAIFKAACELVQEGVEVRPEVMIPLTAHVNEIKVMRELLEKEARAVMETSGVEVHYKFGTMIELPRAALTADRIAEYCDFFSFGTNDLTQTTFGVSRDDAEGKFLLKYVEQGILPSNPFQQLDREGVGKLVEMCVRLGRGTRQDLEAGICGEHGGDPSSIEFCHRAGLNYVSCSPFRVPVARLAAAHAALGESFGDV